MIRPLHLLITGSLLSSACSQPASVPLKEFGEVSVSDSRVVDEQLKVDILNETGQELCYFEDGLFYGPGSIERSEGLTHIARPAVGNQTLEMIKASRTNTYDFVLRKIGQGRHEISIKITGQYPINSGDDLSFDIIYCDPEPDGQHRSLVYLSRFG